MKRDFLEQLGLEKELIDKIMAEHGKSIQGAKPEDYDDLKEKSLTYDQQLNELTNQLASEKEKYTGFETEKNELLEKVKSYELNELRVRVARNNNIPFDLAHRLTGVTEEELDADAKTLATLVTKKEVFDLKEHAEVNDIDAPYREMAAKLTK